MTCSWSSVESRPQAQVLEKKVQFFQESSCPPCRAAPGPHMAQGHDTGAEPAME